MTKVMTAFAVCPTYLCSSGCLQAAISGNCADVSVEDVGSAESRAGLWFLSGLRHLPAPHVPAGTPATGSSWSHDL